MSYWNFLLKNMCIRAPKVHMLSHRKTHKKGKKSDKIQPDRGASSFTFNLTTTHCH